MLGGLGDDTGSAVVEFTLVAILLTALFLALVQLGLALHVRNTLVACAAEGARYGANANRTPDDAAAQTRELIRGALADHFADDVAAGSVVADGVAQVEVRVRATLPLVGLFGPRSLAVTAHSMDEG